METNRFSSRNNFTDIRGYIIKRAAKSDVIKVVDIQLRRERSQERVNCVAKNERSERVSLLRSLLGKNYPVSKKQKRRISI
jgi:hypothetical protein